MELRETKMRIKELKSLFKLRYEHLERLIDSCTRQLSRCPEGRLRIKRQGNCITYYHINDNTDMNGKVIKDLSLIKSLANKAYLKSVFRAASSELKILKPLVRRYESKTAEEIYYSETDDRKALIEPYDLLEDDYIRQWLTMPYKHKYISDNIPVFMTLKGERVRSKSEQIIADRLYHAGIPYKYECPIYLKGIVFHPDFTILRISDRKIIYYEHFGKMDDHDYATDNVDKLHEYGLNGYLLGDNLFATFETLTTPLDTRILDEMIDTHFR